VPKSNLPSERVTPQMAHEANLMALYHEQTEIHECTAFFEHGHWWVACNLCGASWDVVDVEKKGDFDLDLELIDYGDGSCQSNEEEKNGYN
jgi:hypothetical protein